MPSYGNIPSVINITADIPVGMSFVNSIPAPTSQSSTTLTWNNMPITDGAYGFIIVQMKVSNTPPSSMTNTVLVQIPNNEDPIQGNNDQSATVTVPN